MRDGGATDIAILKYGANFLEFDQVQETYACLDKEIGICPFNSKLSYIFQSKFRIEL